MLGPQRNRFPREVVKAYCLSPFLSFPFKVTKVELIIGGEPQKEEGMTERVHLGIAIGVCLAVIAFLGILYLCMVSL